LNGKKDSLLSANFRTSTGIDPFGNRFVDDLDDGFKALSKQVGLDFEFEIADGWTISNSGKYARNSGAFISPFVAGVGTAASITSGVAGGAFTFANGPNRGQAYNGLVASVVLFDVRLNNLDNIANNLKITKEFGDFTATAGYYKSKQNVNQTWNWTSFYEQVSGNNAALLDLRTTPTVANPSGLLTSNGQAGYNATFFGSCCERIYDASYDTDAPFLSLAYERDKLNVDVSIRRDYSQASGTYLGQGIPAAVGPGTIAAPQDFNGDGTISPIEAGILRVDLNNPAPINYKVRHTSYSAGVNYAFTDSVAAFARYSKGARVNADRLLFSATVLPDGSALKGGVINDVKQAELGVKIKGRGYRLFATGFYARTDETNFDPTRPLGSQFSDKAYRAYGLELEGSYQTGELNLTAGATYTKSKIFKDNLVAANVGSPGQRQAKFIYQASADYGVGPARFGLSLAGTTKSFTTDSQQLVQPGYTSFNGFIDFEVVDNLKFSINANNIFNTLGITESGNNTIPASGLITARAIAGRTISGSVKFEF
jgi:outer membrane receptor protein involved in Fe transport